MQGFAIGLRVQAHATDPPLGSAARARGQRLEQRLGSAGARHGLEHGDPEELADRRRDHHKKTTPLGYKTLAAELHELWKVERPRVTQEVSVAGGVSGSAGVDAAGSAPADSPSATSA